MQQSEKYKIVRKNRKALRFALRSYSLTATVRQGCMSTQGDHAGVRRTGSGIFFMDQFLFSRRLPYFNGP